MRISSTDIIMLEILNTILQGQLEALKVIMARCRKIQNHGIYSYNYYAYIY